MSNTLMQGLVLLVAGMGIVYLFLAVMVWIMNRLAQIIPRFNHILPDDEPKKKPRKTVPQPHTAVHGAPAGTALAYDAATCTEITSALPGTVLRVSVKAGDTVAQDDELLVLDVMKMETPVRSHKGGVVAAIKVSVGEKVNTGDLLALIA